MKRIIIDDNSKYYPNQYQLAVNNVVNGFYQTQRFYILPYLPEKFYTRVTFLPYIPKYMKNIGEYSKYSCRKKLPKEISEIIWEGLQEYRNSIDLKYQRFLKKLELVDDNFISIIERITDKKIDQEIRICPKICGTLSSYENNIPEVIEIYPRYDISEDDIYRIILHAIVHSLFFNDIRNVERDQLHMISAKTAEIAKNPLLDKYLGKSKTMPEILQENSCARLIKDSKNYCKKLGYPIKSYIESHKQINGLTQEEEVIFKLLFQNKNNIITFDTIAEELWSEDNIDKYSLYAIAKLIERLRKKLAENNINENLIHTQRSQGYVLYD